MIQKLKYGFLGILIGLLISVGVIHSSRMEDTIRCKLLKTGQTTQYSGELDDGFYKKGITKAYTLLTTGQFSGTSNIYLLHYTSAAGDISFVQGAPDTILSIVTGLDFTTMFVAGDVIRISNATDAGNNAVWTIAAGGVAAHVLILTTNNALTTRLLDGNTINFEKREQHSNHCVIDNNTGLMWNGYASGKMGIASDGKMPWTGYLYDIFQYAAAANLTNLGGYSDWRIPNLFELTSLQCSGPGICSPDSAAFLSFSTSDWIWSSTTYRLGTNNAMPVLFANNFAYPALKDVNYLTILVRGG